MVQCRNTFIIVMEPILFFIITSTKTANLLSLLSSPSNVTVSAELSWHKDTFLNAKPFIILGHD